MDKYIYIIYILPSLKYFFGLIARHKGQNQIDSFLKAASKIISQYPYDNFDNLGQDYNIAKINEFIYYKKTKKKNNSFFI